jgi:hypothetical protein
MPLVFLTNFCYNFSSFFSPNFTFQLADLKKTEKQYVPIFTKTGQFYYPRVPESPSSRYEPSPVSRPTRASSTQPNSETRDATSGKATCATAKK